MNTKYAIDALAAIGLTMHVKHERPILIGEEDVGLGTRAELEGLRSRYQRQDVRFGPKGGVTTVVLKDAAGAEVARRFAYCRPDDERGTGDQFNRRLGTRIALGRALKKLGVKL